MLPTLLVGDHLFVNKFIYGVKLPFTDLRLPGLREPERGDVVVFTVAQNGPQTFPADLRPDLPREEFVKRIIGMPGDRIDFRSGRVFVNGEPIEPRALGETFVDDAGNPARRERGDARRPHLPDPRRSRTCRSRARSTRSPSSRGATSCWATTATTRRTAASGARVRLAEIKGPAFILYWSWDFNGSWAELLNPLTLFELLTQKMRWDRIGDRVRYAERAHSDLRDSPPPRLYFGAPRSRLF